MSASPVWVVVPCYDEARRLDVESFGRLCDTRGVQVVFVDDGSTDATPTLLADLAADRPQVHVVTLGENAGKGEAVRAGLRFALARSGDVVGYLDADLATPWEELLRLAAVLDERDDVDVVLGSRVGLLGVDITRRRARHLQGRVFATLASLVLDLPVYDTQCGAKVFRRTPDLESAVAEPFASRWAFDVELIARLLRRDHDRAARRFVEVPLHRWTDVDGSRLSVRARAAALGDLVRVRRQLRSAPTTR